MSILRYHDINLVVDERKMFDQFNLTIHAGDKILLTGASGSGKSTLLKMPLGFSHYDSGEIFVNDRRVDNLDFRQARQTFAYVDQDVTVRPGKITDVLEQISKFSGNNYSGDFSQELAEQFSFSTKLLDKDTQELSGGERQRFGIILAIMLDRPVFLLDEVTSALDHDLKETVANYFQETEKCVIAISHDPQWNASGAFKEISL